MHFDYKKHLIYNFPENYPWYKKVWANILYFFASIIVFPHREKLTRKDIHRAKAKLRKGDIMLWGMYDQLSSVVIPGKFSHMGIYVGRGRCIHALHNGVCESSLSQLFCDYGMLVIFRPHYTKKNLKKVIQKAQDFLGTPYDYEFELDEEKVYCSEFIMDILEAGDIHLDIFKTDGILYPIDFLESKDLKRVWVSQRVAARSLG